MKNKVLRIRVHRQFKNYSYWSIIAANGEILAHSEIYSSKAKALKTAKLIAYATFEIEVVK